MAFSFSASISIHAPHTGRDLFSILPPPGAPYFNPRAPYGARHGGKQRRRGDSPISIHAPHMGRDAVCAVSVVRPRRISIHAPHTGRDGACIWAIWWSGYFNPRAPYGARRQGDGLADLSGGISIHAPHTGRDIQPGYECKVSDEFQSTRPIRGATPMMSARPARITYFNPRAPYGARLSEMA